jgi:hypothetical protein
VVNLRLKESRRRRQLKNLAQGVFDDLISKLFGNKFSRWQLDVLMIKLLHFSRS